VNEVRKLASDSGLSVALECLARLVTVVLNDAEVKCVYRGGKVLSNEPMGTYFKVLEQYGKTTENCSSVRPYSNGATQSYIHLPCCVRVRALL
jgi:hypothetical protein